MIPFGTFLLLLLIGIGAVVLHYKRSAAHLVPAALKPCLSWLVMRVASATRSVDLTIPSLSFTSSLPVQASAPPAMSSVWTILVDALLPLPDWGPRPRAARSCHRPERVP